MMGAGFGRVPERAPRDMGLCASTAPTSMHRYAYELYHGPIPDGRVVLHTCDNPRCVNPDHLQAGTQQENIQDAVDKGRWMTESRKSWLAKQNASRLPNGQFRPKS